MDKVLCCNSSVDVDSGKKMNWGLSILRIWMSIEVVLSHFWDVGNEKQYLVLFKEARNWAVPCFVMISFFFSERLIHVGDKKKIYKRMYRLVFPQIVWTVIYSIPYYLTGNVESVRGRIILSATASVRSQIQYDNVVSD